MTVTIAAALSRIRNALNSPADADLQDVVAGSDVPLLNGIAVCVLPSLIALRRAVGERRNLVLCDGHPFFLYDPTWSRAASRAETVLASPMVATKLAVIEDGGLCVFRLHAAWRGRFPSAGARALAAQFGFRVTEDRGDHIVCTSTAFDAVALASHLAAHGCGGVRVVGDRSTPSTRLAIVAGMLDAPALARILRDPTINGVVAGDAVEWEAVPYMEDVIASGRRAALFLTGFDASMAPLGTVIADWVRPLYPNLPVTVIDQPDAIRSAA